VITRSTGYSDGKQSTIASANTAKKEDDKKNTQDIGKSE
jgi:hypothetical protein